MAGMVVTTNSYLDEHLEITIMVKLKLRTVPNGCTKIQQREPHHHERRILLIQWTETHPIIEWHKTCTACSNICIPNKKVTQSHHSSHGHVIFAAWRWWAWDLHMIESKWRLYSMQPSIQRSPEARTPWTQYELQSWIRKNHCFPRESCHFSNGGIALMYNCAWAHWLHTVSDDVRTKSI